MPLHDLERVPVLAAVLVDRHRAKDRAAPRLHSPPPCPTTSSPWDKVGALSKRRGFIFPSSEIYGGVGSTYDYGHYGVAAQEQRKARWCTRCSPRAMTSWPLDAAIIMHRARGRRRVTCPASPTARGLPDVRPALPRRQARGRAVPAQALGAPRRGPRLRSHRGPRVQPDVRDDRRPGEGGGSTVYLRPETAQGIFVNFKNVLQFSRKKPPFGDRAGRQVRPERDSRRGTSFPDTGSSSRGARVLRAARRGRQNGSSTGARLAWGGYTDSAYAPTTCGCARTTPTELSHYSSATSDIEYLFPIDWQELEGIANRGDYDLRQPRGVLGEKLEYFDQATASATCRT